MAKTKINIDQKMIIRLVPFIILICAAVFLEKYQTSSRTPSINTTIIQAEGEELDLIMTTWFDNFNRYQDNGETMQKADQLASSAVTLVISNNKKLVANIISK